MVGMRVEKTGKSYPRQETRSALPDSFPVPPVKSQYRPPPALRTRPMSERTAFKPPSIFGREALNIFDPVRHTQSESQLLKTWKRLRQEELKTLVTHPPTNAFEEMILWTEQGKLWKYPIDNEDGQYKIINGILCHDHDASTGLDDEKKVPFYEHVFTDHWMEGLPERGPIRQFMETIAMAMTKNPYITTQRKRETFEWFKKYFELKHDILVRSGSLG